MRRRSVPTRLDLHERGAGAERAEEDRGEQDPDGIGATEERDRDGVEADRRGDARGVEADDAEHLDSAGDSREQARKGHRERGDEDRAHAGVARRVRVLADGTDLEADRRSVQEPAHREDEEHRERNAEMKVAAEQDREGAVPDRSGAREGKPRGADQVVHRPREQ